MHNDPDKWPRRIGIIGVGLLGGSVALAIRRTRPECTIVGFARNPQSGNRLLEQGIVDSVSQSVEEVCRDCEVVVVATPVDRIASLVIQAADSSGPDCLITDVGSTKAKIVESIGSHPDASAKFVAAHPIAGSEKTGADHAQADLMDGKVVILTPTPQTPPERLERAEAFWSLTGGAIHRMDPEQHDTHLATVSHVPHLVSALVARLPAAEARPLVGSGWQDITRVAAGDPAMWTAICQENREAISRELMRFSEQLNSLRQLIDAKDDHRLREWLSEAKRLKQQSK